MNIEKEKETKQVPLQIVKAVFQTSASDMNNSLFDLPQIAYNKVTKEIAIKVYNSIEILSIKNN